MDRIMVKIENVSKEYRLGAIGGTTLREELQSKMAKLQKKEDPNLKIGEEEGTIGQRFMALSDISFEVRKGEAVGIIGRNGAGKSTLLKLLSRVTTPTKGTIYLNGRIASMLEVGTGFHPEMSGRENIYMNGAVLGMKKAEIDAKLEDIIEFSEVSQFIDTPVKRYSSGMYVKLAFSVAAHLDSEILIMDEVLAVGDVKFQQKCIQKMKDIAHSGRTILYVSHNMNTVRSLCDRCIVLEHGKLIYNGNVQRAISIYSGNSESGIKVKKDFRNTLRLREGFGVSLRITEVELLNSRDGIINSDEVAFSVLYDCLKTEYRLQARCIFIREDDYPIATVISDIIHEELNESQNNKNYFKINIQSLVPGKYYMNLIFMYLNINGESTVLDRVEHAIDFMIEKDSEINWDARAWGNIRIKEIEIK